MVDIVPNKAIYHPKTMQILVQTYKSRLFEIEHRIALHSAPAI